MYNSLNNGLEMKIVNILFEMKYIVLGIKGDFYFFMFLFFLNLKKTEVGNFDLEKQSYKEETLTLMTFKDCLIIFFFFL